MADAEVAAHSSRDKAFEIFVKRTITSIQKEAWGRSKEVKEIREACQAFLNRLDQSGAGDDALREVLYPLQLACASNMTKVVELALGCLHKLVAHAWLHGESGPSGTMDLLSAHGSVDGDDAVAQVIKMVIKCGETSNEALQLAVVRALLTFTTAEHFVAHGECLLAAVRAVFNLALSSEDPTNKRTACNALLQMLNTIAKRVTQVQPRGLGSECSAASRTVSEALEIARSTSFHSVPSAGALAAGGPPLSPSRAPGYPGGLPAVYEAAAAAGGASGAGTPTGRDEARRAAQFASLAERSDLRGLEAALEASGASGVLSDDALGGGGGGGGDSPGAATTPTAGGASVRTSYAGQRLSGVGGASEAGDYGSEANGGPRSPSVRGSAPGDAASGGGAANAAGLTLTLAHERAFADAHRARVAGGGGGGGGGPGGAPRLTTYERDVLLVLTAFCKLASREAGMSSAESVLSQGKLLALEMLGRVLGNPQHSWAHVSELFCRHLRQPVCMALLRNCASNDPAAYVLAVRLLAAILSLPRLRLGLRAELGAFYPLLVLRPLEQEAPEPQGLQAALGTLRALVGDPQLVVDLFVNYDCDLQASNLYERTVQVGEEDGKVPRHGWGRGWVG
jgi:brefeldin A-inhibited guanine nucleotide-exchange protein